MTDSNEYIYAEHGFGYRQEFGERPALIVVDLSYGFTDPESRLACDCDDALAATGRLLAAFRERGLPVFFTTVVYDDESLDTAAAFIAKVPALRTLKRGSRWPEIDARVAPGPGEPVLEKLFASAYFGTSLADQLKHQRCDTVVVVGASTSGCVRATAVDALQHGYRVVVARDAVADRSPESHDVSLRDLDAKYGDVLAVDEVIAHLRS